MERKRFRCKFVSIIYNEEGGTRMEKENQYLEYKQEKTNTYLKTVSAFSNYHDGEIIFGVKDNGDILPIKNPESFALDIENQINDSIVPQPIYRIAINNNKTVSIIVEKGLNTPYKYQGKAYKRNHTSTIEVDELELKRLILEGTNQKFDEIISSKQDLSFLSLETYLKRRLGIKQIDEDILRTIGLLTKRGYSNAALLLSEENTFPGLDIVVYGKTTNVFKERIDLSHTSLINQFEKAMDTYERYYVEERIHGRTRDIVERIPQVAFREILVNALLHRLYDIDANTRIEMYPDKIIITSPGELPSGMSYDAFLKGQYSVQRHEVLAQVFHRLGLMEKFATGIRRTNEAYFKFDQKPRFEVTSSSVSVLLPVTEGENVFGLEDDIEFLSELDSNVLYTRERLELLTGIPKSRLIRILNRLIDKKLLQRVGRGKQTYYCK